MTFSENTLQEVRRIIERYLEGKHKSALIPVLHLAQEQNGGWLSTESMDYVAGLLQISPIEVYEVATFYSMFNLQPVGKHVFEVCQTGPCMLKGSDHIIQYIKDKLGIGVGQTTTDGMFTLKVAECLGSCGTAPMLQCGASYHENLTYEKVDQLLEGYQAEGRSRNYTDLDFKNTL